MSGDTTYSAFICKRFYRLGSAMAVARAHRIPYHVVLRILHEEGVRTNRGPSRGSGKNAIIYRDLDPQFIRNSYYSLGSAFAVSRTHQIPYTTVLRILHEEGVTIKQGPTEDSIPPRVFTPEIDAKVIAQYQQGKSCRVLGQELGCSYQAVLNRLRKLGIPIRSVGPIKSAKRR